MVAVAVALAPGGSVHAGPLPEEADPSAAALTRGKEAAGRGDAGAAYGAFAEALRLATAQDGKDAARDALLRLPTPPAPPLTDAERAIVVARIDQERARHLREVANRLLGAGKLRGALRLLETVKGSLEEEATAKVIGDPKAAERREREVADLRVRILGEIPPKEREAADGIAEKHRGDPERLLREAGKLRKEGRLPAARRVLQALVLDPSVPEEPKGRGREALAALEAALLGDLDAEEARAVEEALGHPAFGRLKTVHSREFIFIGDVDLVDRIPERSRFVLDLAYLALTDLAGRVPNPEGDRITVFFKELWDFAGGIGGGKRIDIGRADPKGTLAVPVSTGLYFHELSHCIFDLHPDLPGWVEGIANFGAAFCGAFLRQETDEWHSARGNLEAFRRDFLEREERYWRMAPYGPSAGWFLHWIDAYGRRASGGHDWVRYGRVFRSWRGQTPGPETVHGTARAFGALLTREFGPKVWDDLRAQGFPLEEGTEVDLDLPDGRAVLDAHLRRSEAGSEYATDDERAAARAALGALHGWRVAGPFYPGEREDGLASPFPPEREALFDAEYPSTRQVARWYPPGGGGPVGEDGAGTVTAKWAYPEGSVTYGLVEVEVPADAEALAWVGTEHRWALWVDGVLVEKQEWEAGRFVPDRDRVPLRLVRGRRRILFKAALGWAGPTFAVRLTDREGNPLPGLRCHPAEERPPSPPPEPGKGREWKPFFRDDFARASLGRGWREGPGGFRFRNQEMRGVDDRGRVPWRKYSVRPGFPQDSPSNQLTLDPRAIAKAGEDLRVELHLEGNPKVSLTLDAEEADGGLTGWTVILVPRGREAEVRLERYDRLIHLAAGVPLGEGREHALVVERDGGFVTVRVDGAVALDRVSAPPLARDGLRLCTWGRDPAIRRIELAK